jgi:hypothetical protein
MPLPEQDITIQITEIKDLVKKHVDNYPDLEAMVTSGELVHKAGWYEPQSTEALNAIIHYATSVRHGKNGKTAVKIPKLSKRLKTLATMP